MANISTLNQRRSLAWNRQTSIAELYEWTKPGKKTYSLAAIDGLVWQQKNNSTQDTWSWERPGGVIYTTADSSACGGTIETAYTYRGRYRLNCTANQDIHYTGTNCNCTNACGNCYTHYAYENPISVNQWNGAGITYGDGQCVGYYQCAQCDVAGNCDDKYWFQGNCQCLACDCACNCGYYGQCTAANCVCTCECG